MTTARTALQADAWHRPFLSGEKLNVPARIEEPRRGWYVALSINL